MLSTEIHCFTVMQLKSKVSSGCEGDRIISLSGFGVLLASFGTLQPGLHHVTFNLHAHMDMAFPLFLCLRQLLLLVGTRYTELRFHSIYIEIHKSQNYFCDNPISELHHILRY